MRHRAISYTQRLNALHLLRTEPIVTGYRYLARILRREPAESLLIDITGTDVCEVGANAYSLATAATAQCDASHAVETWRKIISDRIAIDVKIAWTECGMHIYIVVSKNVAASWRIAENALGGHSEIYWRCLIRDWHCNGRLPLGDHHVAIGWKQCVGAAIHKFSIGGETG